MLDDVASSGHGILVAAAHGLTAGALGGRIAIEVAHQTTWLIGLADQQKQLTPPALALSSNVPGRGSGGDRDGHPPYRLIGCDRVTVHWVRLAEPGIGEMVLVADAGGPGRVQLLPAHAPDRAWRCNLLGDPLGDLSLTSDRDGWTLNLARGELAVIRWSLAVA